MDAAMNKMAEADAGHGISFSEAFRVWFRVACLSFGGPAGQIAVMHRILVEEKNWISEGRFLHALNYCMLLPGPEAQQLATYIGWLMHRTAGGLMAGGLFILPGIIGIIGYVGAKRGRLEFAPAGHGHGGSSAAIDSMLGEAVPDHVRPDTARTIRVGALWLALWLVPVIAVLVLFGEASVFSQIALFFSKMALVTFGG